MKERKKERKVSFTVMAHTTLCLKRIKKIQMKLNEKGKYSVRAVGEALKAMFRLSPGLKDSAIGTNANYSY